MANNGDSFLHNARPITKVSMALLFLVSLIVTNHIFKALILLAIPIALILLSRVNVREILHLAAYPLVFSILFALIRTAIMVAGLLVMTMALGAALNMLLLIATTPYTDSFGIFSYVLRGRS